MSDSEAVEARRFGNYINGIWRPARSGATFESVDPSNGRVIGRFAASDNSDVDDAVAAARAAFPGWRATPAPRRGEILFRFAALLAENKERLSRAMTNEMGRVIAEARGDVQEGIDIAYLMAGEGRRLFGDTVPSELPDKWAMSVREPLGVAGLITPWNFPVAIPCWKMMPALIAGNTVVWKPASDTPHDAVLLVEILAQAGFPPGVVNLVTGSGPAVGMPIVKHHDVAVVGFTGNGETGRSIASEGIADELVARLAARAQALSLGSGLDGSIDVGPLINEAAVRKVESYIEIGKGEGSTLVTGGGRATAGELSRGHFFELTIFDHVEPGSRLGQEEIFGPLLSVIRVSDYEAAVKAVTGVRYGLSSSIFTSDTNTAFRAMRDFDTGIVYINAGTIGAETHLPFGGTKATGNGHREAGHAALDTYTEWKAIYVDYSGTLQRAQIDNQPSE